MKVMSQVHNAGLVIASIWKAVICFVHVRLGLPFVKVEFDKAKFDKAEFDKVKYKLAHQIRLNSLAALTLPTSDHRRYLWRYPVMPEFNHLSAII